MDALNEKEVKEHTMRELTTKELNQVSGGIVTWIVAIEAAAFLAGFAFGNPVKAY